MNNLRLTDVNKLKQGSLKRRLGDRKSKFHLNLIANVETGTTLGTPFTVHHSQQYSHSLFFSGIKV